MTTSTLEALFGPSVDNGSVRYGIFNARSLIYTERAVFPYRPLHVSGDVYGVRSN